MLRKKIFNINNIVLTYIFLFHRLFAQEQTPPPPPTTTPPPPPIPVGCLKSPLQAPKNGSLLCSFSSQYTASSYGPYVCRVKCKYGFSLIYGSSCDDYSDNPYDAWGKPAPTCAQINCHPNQLQAPRNGLITCSNANSFASICRFECYPGYYRYGAAQSHCLDDGHGGGKGVWSEPAPICSKIVCLPQQVAPGNGSFSCSESNNVGSVCSFNCDSKYFLEGSLTSTCEDDLDGGFLGVWSNPPPLCSPITCPRLQNTLVNVNVLCTRMNDLGSVCSFTCHSGYFLDGVAQSTCINDRDGDADGAWTHPPPTCVKIKCLPPQKDVKNRSVTCTDSNNIESTCRFECRSGFHLDGSAITSCNYEPNGGPHGVWSSQSPVCRQVTCSPRYDNLQNDNIFCTNENNEGSKCLFICNSQSCSQRSIIALCEDDMDGDDKGVWSNQPTSCLKSTCTPRYNQLENGFVNCTDSNYEKSTCTFTCISGYYLVGSRSATCNDDNISDFKGVWSTQLPICEKITCASGHSSINKGSVTCTETNIWKSKCNYSCQPGYYIYGSKTITCEDDNDGDAEGVWSDQHPVCRRITCSPKYSYLENGLVFCRNSNYGGSRCVFICKSGFDLKGSSLSYCTYKGNNNPQGVWSSQPPTCQKRTCMPRHEMLNNGFVYCTDSNNVGSICSFDCITGFYTNSMEFATITCEAQQNNRTGGVWSGYPPVCRKIVCSPSHRNFENGFVSCSNKNYPGSECRFTCYEPFELVGSHTILCRSDLNTNQPGKWSNTAPYCHVNRCPNQNLPRGNVTCDNKDNIASTSCTFKCNHPNYSLYPVNVTKNTCLNNSTWSVQRPCCRAKCPPTALLDLAILVDSSPFLQKRNWDIMMNFVENLTKQFQFGDDSIRVAAFRYNQVVDQSTQILLNRYRNATDFIKALAEIPYKGTGTRIGHALTHAQRVIFQQSNGDRPNVQNVLLLITSAQNQDTMRLAASLLRNNNVLIYVLGIDSRDRTELINIAGDPKHVLVAQNFAELMIDDNFLEILTNQICDSDPCPFDSRS